MSDSGLVVADASAVIALLVDEPFTRFEPQRLVTASISAVNLSEVLARLLQLGVPESAADGAVAGLDLQIVAFDDKQARTTARLREVTRHAGLSLADRACLALGLHLNAPVVTADRVWAAIEVGVEIVLIH